MRWDVTKKLPYNSFDYFEKTLITDNGFREYDVRWVLGKEINPNGFVVLGKAYGTFARDILKEERVVVGHDFRSYSQDLCSALTVGLMSTGAHVIDIGLAVTPLTYFAQHHFGARCAAMVTASHNENGWTGLKLADGLSSTLGPDGILQFKQIVMGGKYASGKGIARVDGRGLRRLSQGRSSGGEAVAADQGRPRGGERDRRPLHPDRPPRPGLRGA